MSFEITPARDGAPVTTQAFPQFIQVQQDGVNLGGPDVTTLNFVGFDVARGEGEEANTVTIALPDE